METQKKEMNKVPDVTDADILLLNLFIKLEEVQDSPAWMRVFQIAQAHDMGYDGPQFEDEYLAAEQYLRDRGLL